MRNRSRKLIRLLFLPFFGIRIYAEFRFDFRMFRIIAEIVRNSRVQNFDMPKILSFAFVSISEIAMILYNPKMPVFIQVMPIYILLR